MIQEIKGRLYARDFAAAFGREEYLEAYAARWSPSRALAYAELLLEESELGTWLLESDMDERHAKMTDAETEDAKGSTREHGGIEDGVAGLDLGRYGGSDGGRETDDRDAEPSFSRVMDGIPSGVGVAKPPSQHRSTATVSKQSSGALIPRPQRSRRSIACLGGGAGAELVAFAGISEVLREKDGRSLDIHLDILDSAPWALVLSSLHQALPDYSLSTQSPESISLANNDSLSGVSPLPESFTYTFTQADLLSTSFISSSNVELERSLRDADIVTLFFTLNELYASNRARATGLLLALGDTMKVRARLVVVDSAGSYAGVGLGVKVDGSDRLKLEGEKRQQTAGSKQGESCRAEGRKVEKRYPMQWLLDHTLLELACKENSSGMKGKGKRKWGKILGEDSEWFRRSDGLKYQVSLEDMRFQMHIYERI